jgi:hypothetical protein
MVDLGASTNLLDRYKVLSRQDLSVQTSVISPQVHRQRNKSLPWFWTMDVRWDEDVREWMKDCMCISVHMHSMNVSFGSVYRVHWLHSKSQKMRWIEELQCLQVEMGSAVRFFVHQQQFWHAKGEAIDSQLNPGHAAWAARQSQMWCSMANQAESIFATILKNDPPPDFAKVSSPHSTM